MHELGITQGIIDRARDVAVENGAHRVTDLYITMTPAADFTFDSIEMYFAMLTEEDDLFQGARLHVDRAPAATACLTCGGEFSTAALQPVCPRCGSAAVQVDPKAPMVRITDVVIDEGA